MLVPPFRELLPNLFRRRIGKFSATKRRLFDKLNISFLTNLVFYLFYFSRKYLSLPKPICQISSLVFSQENPSYLSAPPGLIDSPLRFHRLFSLVQISDLRF